MITDGTENRDFYTILGATTELMAASIYHRHRNLKTYFYFQIFPAIRVGQIKIFFSTNGIPEALVTWAWLKDETIDELLSEQDRSIKEAEWNMGSTLFFNDFIAPYGNMRAFFKYIFVNVFPKEDVGFSIRRNNDGSIRKKNIWYRHKFVAV